MPSLLGFLAMKQQKRQRQNQRIDKQQENRQAKAHLGDRLKHHTNQVEVVEQEYCAVIGNGRERSESCHHQQYDNESGGSG